MEVEEELPGDSVVKLKTGDELKIKKIEIAIEIEIERSLHIHKLIVIFLFHEEKKDSRNLEVRFPPKSTKVGGVAQ